MIDWSDYGIYNDERNLPTDWVPVTSLSSGGGYEWATLYAFYSPSARRFFWSGESGCSCNGWGDDLNSEEDYESGDKAALTRAIRDFGSCGFAAVEVVDAISDVQRFKAAS